MTNDERRRRNEVLAKRCGWEIAGEPSGTPSYPGQICYRAKNGVILVRKRHDLGSEFFDATRRVGDCKRVEEAMGVRACIDWKGNRCRVTLLNSEDNFVGHGDELVEAESRSAACEAAIEGGA